MEDEHEHFGEDVEDVDFVGFLSPLDSMTVSMCLAQLLVVDVGYLGDLALELRTFMNRKYI